MNNFPDFAKALTPTLNGSGILAGFAAFIGASCCVVPILLVHMGVASALVARLSWFARWQETFFWGAAILLALSLGMALMRGRPARAFWIWWGLGACFLAIAQILPHYEAELQHALLQWTRR